MRLRRIALSTLIACGLLAGGAGAAKAQNSLAAGVHIGPSGRASVDLAFFHDDLAPYGRWVHQSVYGDVFVPRVRYSHWRPYQYGHWVYTDYGWTWVSSESFGWATYHYGRWAYDPDYGWIWVPGTEWGPAWVAWQSGDDYVGWAALPPTVGFDAGYGVDFGGFAVGVDIAPVDYVFVPQNRFLVSDVGSYCLAPQQNVSFFGRTRNITNYAVVGGRVIDRALPVTTVERWAGRRVPRYQVADMRSYSPRPRIQGNRLQIFRPAVNAPRNARTAERIAAENRSANAPARIAQRRAAQARMAAVQGRNGTRTDRQAAAINARQAGRLENARGRQQVRGQAQRQQIAARAQEQRVNERAQARNQRQQIAARAAQQRGNQRAQARNQRQQIAARGQAERSRERAQMNVTGNRERAQANAERAQQRAQAARSQERAQARGEQRAQAQAARGQQRAQARAERQAPPRQQVAQQRQQQRQQQQRQHGRPPQQGGQDQRRPHGGA